MSDNHKPETVELDIRGQICPSCLLLALKELNRLGADIRSGKLVMLVITDDRQATATIPETVARMGFRTEVVRANPGYRIRIVAA